MKEIQDRLTQKINNIAQKCPVCNGWGTVSYKRVRCHACRGDGFILINKEIEREKGYDQSD